MKKILFLTMLAALTALTSCSKSEDGLQNPNEGMLNATFNVQLPAPATRATGDAPTRYIVEAHEGGTLSGTPIRVESATGALNVILKKGTIYTFLFWADKGTPKNGETTPSSGYYNATSLQAVTPETTTSANPGQVAYYCAKTFNSDEFDKNQNGTPTLTHAVASVNLVQEGSLILTEGNTVKIGYADMGTFNVADGTITPNTPATPVTHSFTTDMPYYTLATDYVLAASAKALTTLTITFNNELAKTLNNVPLQCNYKTNISGEYSNIYSSEFTINSTVEDYTDQEFPQPKVGNYYYQDGTYGDNYSSSTTNPCIGIIFWIDPTNANKGKIVSLDEPIESLAWTISGQTENVANAESTSDGKANTDAILAANNYSPTNYPAIAWCVAKNTPTPPAGISWYLPATEELVKLSEAWNGNNSSTPDPTARAAFNAKLTSAGGTGLREQSYLSSTEIDRETVIRLNLGYPSNPMQGSKTDPYWVRAVSAF